MSPARTQKSAVFGILLALLAAPGCEKPWEEPIGADAAHHPDSSLQDAGSPDRLEPDAQATPDWQSLLEQGDAAGDCANQDATCLADLADLRFRQTGRSLDLEVSFHRAFPRQTGSFEIFLIPPDPQIVGHSLRIVPGRGTWWNADCSSAVRNLKHLGCHWTTQPFPSSLQFGWVDEEHFRMSVDLDEIGFQDLDSLLLGVAAAPFVIQVTAEFTDRYPDELLVTATAVQGLAEASLQPGSSSP